MSIKGLGIKVNMALPIIFLLFKVQSSSSPVLRNRNRSCDWFIVSLFNMVILDIIISLLMYGLIVLLVIILVFMSVHIPISNTLRSDIRSMNLSLVIEVSLIILIMLLLPSILRVAIMFLLSMLSIFISPININLKSILVMDGS
jgi:hypothetical protein